MGADQNSLKKILGGNHIIKAEIDQNNLSGANTGNGRLSIRLREGQKSKDVQEKLTQAGVTFSRRNTVSNRNNDFTANQYESKEKKKWTKG